MLLQWRCSGLVADGEDCFLHMDQASLLSEPLHRGFALLVTKSFLLFPTDRKMAKIYSYVAGNTLESHQKFLKKLTKKGAKTVNSPEEREATIVFCPIVSRFESDINAALDAALSKIPDLRSQKVILVAMHHTFDPDYTLPNNRDQNPLVTFQVDCLFYKDMGLFRCARNKMAWKKVREELGLRAGRFAKIPKK